MIHYFVMTIKIRDQVVVCCCCQNWLSTRCTVWKWSIILKSIIISTLFHDWLTHLICITTDDADVIVQLGLSTILLFFYYEFKEHKWNNINIIVCVVDLTNTFKLLLIVHSTGIHHYLQLEPSKVMQVNIKPLHWKTMQLINF